MGFKVAIFVARSTQQHGIIRKMGKELSSAYFKYFTERMSYIAVKSLPLASILLKVCLLLILLGLKSKLMVGGEIWIQYIGWVHLS